MSALSNLNTTDETQTLVRRCARNYAFYLLFHACTPATGWTIFINAVTGIIAVVTIPTVVFGTIGNLLLIHVLIRAIRRPRRLELWGVLMAVLDIVLFCAGGLVFLYPTYGIPWWGVIWKLPTDKHHLGCKASSTALEFVSVARINTIFSAFIRELTSTRHIYGIAAKKDLTGMWIFVVLVVSLMQSAPTMIIYGLWQFNGAFICSLDPIWSLKYHHFFLIHRILFLDGFFQVICAAFVGIPLWIRLKRGEQLVRQLSSCMIGKTVVHHVLEYAHTQLNESCRNLRILMPQATVLLILRFCRVWTRYKTSIVLFPGPNPEDLHTFEIHTAMLSLWNFFMVIEIILSSFTCIWWFRHSPEMHRFMQRTWHTLLRVAPKQVKEDKPERVSSIHRRQTPLFLRRRKTKEAMLQRQSQLAFTATEPLDQILRTMIQHKLLLIDQYKVKFESRIPGTNAKRPIVTQFKRMHRKTITESLKSAAAMRCNPVTENQ